MNRPEASYGLLGKDLGFFSSAGFDMDKIHLKRNAPVAQLYEDAVKFEVSFPPPATERLRRADPSALSQGAVISASGALINFSGKKTGRSPKDKRIVQEETSKDDIWVSGAHTHLPLPSS